MDVTQIELDNQGNFIISSKDSKETQNMLYYTYKYHKQACSPIFSKPINHIELIDKMNAVSKYILDNMEDLLGREKYMSLRDFKRTIYNDRIKRIEFTNSLLSNFVITELNSSIKSTCIKIFQTIITFTDITRIDYIYSKIDLAKEIATLFSFEYDFIIALITRGKYGIPDLTEINKIFQIIVKRFLDVSNEILVDFIFFLKNEPSVVPFNPNPINILLIEFLKSPIVPTNEFIQQMEKVNPGRSLNKGYIIGIFR